MMKHAKVMVMVLAVVLMASLTQPTRAQEEQNQGSGVSVSLEAACLSAYMFRGIPYNEETVIQPYASISRDGFTLSAWGSVDMTNYGKDTPGWGDENGSLMEIDYTGSYEFSLDKLAVGFGFGNYTFPNTEFVSTTEAFAYLALDVPLHPSVTYYLDVDGPYSAPASYLSIDLSHSFTLWEQDDASLALDFSAHAGHASNEWIFTYWGFHDGDKWHDWSATVGLPMNLGYGFALRPAYGYYALLHNELRDEMDDGWDREPARGVWSVSLGWSGEVPLP